MADRRLRVRDNVEVKGISNCLVVSISNDYLGKRKLSERSLPRMLKIDHKLNRVTTWK